MTRLLLVCAGGAVGSGARYLLAVWAARQFGTTFPYGTLLVNVSGCFLLALLVQVGTVLSPDLRLALATGLLGGFTTYSTFNYETTAYAREGAWLAATANAAITLLACFGAGLLGAAAGRLISSH
ncbi:MAG TPA: fluoride efflux transporter CrcB [Thermoanaerobaculia bacterium]|nr:fluoride efflux transporter CrcB [Thermoanaerobaculia bacterium]